jgi:hypothetical protein
LKGEIENINLAKRQKKTIKRMRMTIDIKNKNKNNFLIEW